MLPILTFILAFTILQGPAAQEPATQPPPAQQPAAQKPAEESACGPSSEKLKNETDKSSHPEPPVPPDKALVYVVRPTMLGNKVQTKFAVDGQWVGVNRGNNYFFLTLAPGSHRFCSQAENSDSASLVLEAGKVYFFQQHVEMGILKARTSLERIDEQRGREALKKCHLSVTEKK